MSSPVHILGRDERLKSRNRINRLFEQGKGGMVFPLRYVILEEAVEDEKSLKKSKYDSTAPVSILVSVPKRHHKRAVQRNLLKRRIREVYRLNKETLITHQSKKSNVKLSIAFLYIAPEVNEYPVIENAVKKILDKLTQSR